jgi:hypothetical protein
MEHTEKIDVSKYLAASRVELGGRAETEDVSRHNHPERETRPALEKLLYPDFYEKQQRERGR